jgi:hypothetical protein
MLDRKRRRAESYKLAVDTSDLLDFAYLGQLGQLMLSRKAWSLFGPMFRDKRELEDMMRDVAPVRNDSAHFRSVPPLELARCRVRCEDLIAIIDAQPDSG